MFAEWLVTEMFWTPVMAGGVMSGVVKFDGPEVLQFPEESQEVTL